MRLSALMPWILCIAMLAAADPARTIHVAPDGDDDRDGRTAATAWRSLAKVSALELNPGDQVILAAGEHKGSLSLDRADAGSADNPIRIEGAGRGRTVIVSPEASAISLRDCGGIEIRGLSVRGDANSPRRNHAGISAYTDDAGGARFARLVIAGVAASGFGDHGIVIGSWHESYPGWDDVLIDDCEANENQANGIMTFDLAGQTHTAYAHHRVTIRNCHAGGNRSGSGIVIAGVDVGLVEHCTAIGNVGTSAGVGIWAYSCHALVIDHCLAAGTRTTGKDGGGFDLDGGCSACVVQRCLSYDNDGPGYMHCDYPNARPTRNNVIRLCASVDDGRNHAGGAGLALVTWGNGLDDCHIHSCTVWAEYPELGGNPLLRTVFLTGWTKPGDVPHLRGCSLRGNLVVARTPGAVLFEDQLPEPGPAAVVVAGNWYSAPQGRFVQMPGADPTKARHWDTLADWRAATSCERSADGDLGGEGAPGLSAPSSERPIATTALATLPWLRRQPGSALDRIRIPRAVLPDLPAGLTDLFSASLPVELVPGWDQVTR